MIMFKKLKNLKDTGFTIVEILIVIAIIGTLATIAVPGVQSHITRSRNSAAVSDIRKLEKDILVYRLENDTYPNSLSDMDDVVEADPWGNPYQYMRITGAPGEKPRKDRFLVPVNTDFDLYSKGKDGDSVAPFTAKASRDDIVRANNGGYVGVAEGF